MIVLPSKRSSMHEKLYSLVWCMHIFLSVLLTLMRKKKRWDKTTEKEKFHKQYFTRIYCGVQNQYQVPFDNKHLFAQEENRNCRPQPLEPAPVRSRPQRESYTQNNDIQIEVESQIHVQGFQQGSTFHCHSILQTLLS